MRTRQAFPEDWDVIWPLWHAVVAEGDTCAWDPATDEATARAVWMCPPPAEVLIMEEDTGPDGPAVVATALLTPSLPGLGNHVAQATLLVDPKWVDHGGSPHRVLGPDGLSESPSRLAAEQMIEYAVERGYRAMQLNAVVSVNPKLVAMWRSLAFRLVGTLPAALRHPWHGDVDLYVMYRFLPTHGR